MNWNKKTRLQMARFGSLFMAGISIYAIHKGMEGVAMTSLGSIGTIIMVFIGGDSFRKSDA